MDVITVFGERGIKSLSRQQLDRAVVIIDVFRASTTITIALEMGVKCIIPVKTIREAMDLKGEGYLIVGEEDGLPPKGFDQDNSPHLISQMNLKDQIMVLRTTNGTRGIVTSMNKGFSTYIGSLRNARSLAEFIKKRHSSVALVPMGTKEKPRVEDDVCANILRAYLLNEPIIEDVLIGEIRQHRENDNPHIPTWKEDVSICLSLNQSTIIPFCINDPEMGTCIIEISQQQ